jgi:hypothetical protein
MSYLDYGIYNEPNAYNAASLSLILLLFLDRIWDRLFKRLELIIGEFY